MDEEICAFWINLCTDSTLLLPLQMLENESVYKKRAMIIITYFTWNLYSFWRYLHAIWTEQKRFNIPKTRSSTISINSLIQTKINSYTITTIIHMVIYNMQTVENGYRSGYSKHALVLWFHVLGKIVLL